VERRGGVWEIVGEGGRGCRAGGLEEEEERSADLDLAPLDFLVDLAVAVAVAVAPAAAAAAAAASALALALASAASLASAAARTSPAALAFIFAVFFSAARVSASFALKTFSVSLSLLNNCSKSFSSLKPSYKSIFCFSFVGFEAKVPVLYTRQRPDLIIRIIIVQIFKLTKTRSGFLQSFFGWPGVCGQVFSWLKMTNHVSIKP
jgi:hypothetical protein